MTTTAAPTATAVPPPAPAGVEPPPLRRLGDAVANILTMAHRNLLVWSRVPAYIVFTIVQPIMFVLMFRYVFGGAIHVNIPGGYVTFLLPGIIAQTAAFASMGTAIVLAQETQLGVTDRFRSMPIARSAWLAGRLLADVARMALTVVVIVGVGYAVGFRFHNGVLPAIWLVVVAVTFGLSVCCISAFVGLTVKDQESAQALGMIWLFPLSFVSAAFVPIASMPGWMQGFARNQPFTLVVNSMRSLALGGPLTRPVWQAAVCIVGVLVVFLPLAVRAYRRAT